jgi:Uma2 family endonuclease
LLILVGRILDGAYKPTPTASADMVALKEHFPRFTPEEYFTWEEQQLERHEYMDGEVYAMSGGTINHGDIALNFGVLLKTHMRGSGCKTLNSDCRVKVFGMDKYVYPDTSVTCDDRDKTTTQYISYPCLIIEVLSPSTVRAASAFAEAYDRGNKFKMYRRNPSLQEYVLVSADTIEVELFRRTQTDDWRIINYQAGDTVELKSVNLTFPIEQIYEDIVFPEPET